jgi:hypothetical protein
MRCCTLWCKPRLLYGSGKRFLALSAVVLLCFFAMSLASTPPTITRITNTDSAAFLARFDTIFFDCDGTPHTHTHTHKCTKYLHAD